MEDRKVVTRFAPSPTGFLHLGNYRTAIFAYLYARKNKGKFIVRIEDTDRERSKKEYEENIIESLEWLGLKYDQLYRQSENLPVHTKYLEKLINSGYAYISKEEAKDGSNISRELVRFKNKSKMVSFEDEIRGEIKTDTKDLGDFVIAKSISEPLFHFAVVVDDHEEGVTHVIRGEDHIPNTPRQILIARALGFKIPSYIHLPLVLAGDRTKLSKRKGALPITFYKEEGFLPEALFNFMAFIGWNPGGEKEIYQVDELVQVFNIKDIQKGGAIFNQEKLLWTNREHIKRQNAELQLSCIKPYMKDYGDDVLRRLLPTIVERISNYGELKNIEKEEFRFFIEKPKIDINKLNWKNVEFSETKNHLIEVEKLLNESEFSLVENIKNKLMPYAEQAGRGKVLWPLRFALSGKDKSIDPFTICYVSGKKETLSRIRNAIALIDSQ